MFLVGACQLGLARGENSGPQTSSDRADRENSCADRGIPGRLHFANVFGCDVEKLASRRRFSGAAVKTGLGEADEMALNDPSWNTDQGV